MNTPKANQSTNEMEVLVGSRTVLSTGAAEFISTARTLHVSGYEDSDGLIISVYFYSPDTPAQLKKNDVLRVGHFGGVQLFFRYSFGGAVHSQSATEGHLTVEEIDLSVSLFKARFEFSGPHSGGVEHFHGRFSVRG